MAFQLAGAKEAVQEILVCSHHITSDWDGESPMARDLKASIF